MRAYSTMPLRPPIECSIFAMPLVEVSTKVAVALLMLPINDASTSLTPNSVLCMPSPRARMIWLLPDAMDEIVCPNKLPMPAIRLPFPCSRNRVMSSKFCLFLANSERRDVLDGRCSS